MKYLVSAGAVMYLFSIVSLVRAVQSIVISIHFIRTSVYDQLGEVSVIRDITDVTHAYNEHALAAAVLFAIVGTLCIITGALTEEREKKEVAE